MVAERVNQQHVAGLGLWAGIIFASVSSAHHMLSSLRFFRCKKRSEIRDYPVALFSTRAKVSSSTGRARFSSRLTSALPSCSVAAPPTRFPERPRSPAPHPAPSRSARYPRRTARTPLGPRLPPASRRPATAASTARSAAAPALPSVAWPARAGGRGTRTSPEICGTGSLRRDADGPIFSMTMMTAWENHPGDRRRVLRSMLCCTS